MMTGVMTLPHCARRPFLALNPMDYQNGVPAPALAILDLGSRTEL